MARVQNTRLVSSASAAAARHKIAVQKTKPSYKVVIEQLTEKKRKLVTVLSFNTTAPSGYTFIPAGDPQITSRCKQIAREEGLKVFIVSTSKHQQVNHELSHEVHRVGYHFPSIIVERACTSLGVSLSNSGRVLEEQRPSSARLRYGRSKKGKKGNPEGKNGKNKPGLSQAALDTEAREAIRDLFPKIPEKDLHQIITRAFKKGKDRVGTAAELPLARRVQLAVVAHIRHIYTDYDLLLRTNDYLVARRKVEQPCLDVLTQWREDEEDDPDAMEDILREVIVIPDDDDGNVDDVEGLNLTVDPGRFARSCSQSRSRSRENSVEFVSAQTIIDSTTEQPLNSASPYCKDISEQQISPAEYRYVRPDPALSAYGAQRRPRLLREENHRHQAWEEARTRRRQNPTVVYPKQWAIGHHDWDQIRVEPLSKSPQHIDLTRDQEPLLISPTQQKWSNEPSRRLMTPKATLENQPPAKIRRVPQEDSCGHPGHEESAIYPGTSSSPITVRQELDRPVDRITSLSNYESSFSTKQVYEHVATFPEDPRLRNGKSHPLSSGYRQTTNLFSPRGTLRDTFGDSKVPTSNTVQGYISGTQNPARPRLRPVGNASAADPSLQTTEQWGARLHPGEQDRRIVFLKSPADYPADHPTESLPVGSSVRILEDSSHGRQPPEHSKSIEQIGQFLEPVSLMPSQHTNKRRYVEVVPGTNSDLEPGGQPMEIRRHHVLSQDPGFPRADFYPVYDQFTTHLNLSPDHAAYNTRPEYRRIDPMAERAQRGQGLEPASTLFYERSGSSNRFEETAALVSRDSPDRRVILLSRDNGLANSRAHLRTESSQLMINAVKGPSTDHRIRLLPARENAQFATPQAVPGTLWNKSRIPMESTLGYIPRADGEHEATRAQRLYH